jgi:hypothetical protein
MTKRDENLEKGDQLQESALEVTELDDQDLEGVSGGLIEIEAADTNTNCHTC